MATDWRTLLGARTGDQVLQTAFERLAQAGSRITNLNVGGVFRTLLELASDGLGDLYDLLVAVAPQGFASTATGAWLTLLARDRGLTRIAAATTAGRVRFSRAGAAGNLVIPANVLLRTPLSAQGERLEYLTTAETVLPDGASSVLVPITARAVGARYNVAPGLISELVAHVPGIVAVANEADWITSEGRDAETDAELRLRTLNRWPALARGATAAAYATWAREVSGVVDVAVDDDFPRGEGTVDVVVMGEAGAPSDDLLAAVQALLDTRRPLCADVLVRGPVEVPAAVRLRLSLPLDGGDEATTEAAALAFVDSLLSSGALTAVPRLGLGRTLARARLAALGMGLPLVHNVAVELPIADVAAGPDGLIVLEAAPEILVVREAP